MTTETTRSVEPPAAETPPGVPQGTPQPSNTPQARTGRCSQTCVKPSPSQAHCPTCHRTFGGVTGFDAHRRAGACVDPAKVGYVLTGAGVWRVPMDPAYLARVATRPEERS